MPLDADVNKDSADDNSESDDDFSQTVQDHGLARKQSKRDISNKMQKQFSMGRMKTKCIQYDRQLKNRKLQYKDDFKSIMSKEIGQDPIRSAEEKPYDAEYFVLYKELAKNQEQVKKITSTSIYSNKIQSMTAFNKHITDTKTSKDRMIHEIGPCQQVDRKKISFQIGMKQKESVANNLRTYKDTLIVNFIDRRRLERDFTVFVEKWNLGPDTAASLKNFLIMTAETQNLTQQSKIILSDIQCFQAAKIIEKAKGQLLTIDKKFPILVPMKDSYDPQQTKMVQMEYNDKKEREKDYQEHMKEVRFIAHRNKQTYKSFCETEKKRIMERIYVKLKYQPMSQRVFMREIIYDEIKQKMCLNLLQAHKVALDEGDRLLTRYHDIDFFLKYIATGKKAEFMAEQHKVEPIVKRLAQKSQKQVNKGYRKQKESATESFNSFNTNEMSIQDDESSGSVDKFELKNYDQRQADSWIQRATKKQIAQEMSVISSDSMEDLSNSSDKDATILRPTEVFNRKKDLNKKNFQKLEKQEFFKQKMRDRDFIKENTHLQMFDNFLNEFCKDSANIDGGFSQTISKMKANKNLAKPQVDNYSRVESARSMESSAINKSSSKSLNMNNFMNNKSQNISIDYQKVQMQPTAHDGVNPNQNRKKSQFNKLQSQKVNFEDGASDSDGSSICSDDDSMSEDSDNEDDKAANQKINTKQPFQKNASRKKVTSTIFDEDEDDM